MRHSLSNFTDEALTEMFNDGNTSAFEEIYNRYWPILLRTAYKMIRDQELSEDVTQDIFTDFYNRRGTLKLKTTLSAFLYQSVRYQIIGVIRKNTVVLKHEQYLAGLEQSRNYTDEHIHEKELRMIIEREVANLPPKMRRVFELSRKAYLSYQQIAEMQNSSERTVETQLYRAKKILKEKIAGYFFLQVMLFILWLYR